MTAKVKKKKKHAVDFTGQYLPNNAHPFLSMHKRSKGMLIRSGLINYIFARSS